MKTMNKEQILYALNTDSGALRGSVRTQDGKQLDQWNLNGKDYLIVTTRFWNYKSSWPSYTAENVVRVQLLTTID